LNNILTVLVLRRTPYKFRFCQVVTAQVKLNLCGEILGPLFSSDLQTKGNVFELEVSTTSSVLRGMFLTD